MEIKDFYGRFELGRRGYFKIREIDLFSQFSPVQSYSFLHNWTCGYHKLLSVNE